MVDDTWWCDFFCKGYSSWNGWSVHFHLVDWNMFCLSPEHSEMDSYKQPWPTNLPSLKWQSTMEQHLDMSGLKGWWLSSFRSLTDQAKPANEHTHTHSSNSLRCFWNSFWHGIWLYAFPFSVKEFKMNCSLWTCSLWWPVYKAVWYECALLCSRPILCTPPLQSQYFSIEASWCVSSGDGRVWYDWDHNYFHALRAVPSTQFA